MSAGSGPVGAVIALSPEGLDEYVCSLSDEAKLQLYQRLAAHPQDARGKPRGCFCG